MTTTQTTAIERACGLLLDGNIDAARESIRTAYPFDFVQPTARQRTERDAMQVYVRDGFLDRYSGTPLVFPAVLRVMSIQIPDAFPFHTNWKMSECHQAYWQLFPTIDHVVPVARGGDDTPDNWVTTTMLRNAAKSNWTLDELGWSLHPPGRFADWDGLSGWFLQYADKFPEILADAYVARWQRAAISILSK